MSNIATDRPMSVRRDFVTSSGIEYLWDKYRRDAASSPFGPPRGNCLSKVEKMAAIYSKKT